MRLPGSDPVLTVVSGRFRTANSAPLLSAWPVSDQSGEAIKMYPPRGRGISMCGAGGLGSPGLLGNVGVDRIGVGGRKHVVEAPHALRSDDSDRIILGDVLVQALGE